MLLLLLLPETAHPDKLRTAFRVHDTVGLALPLPAAFAGFFLTGFAVATRFCCDFLLPGDDIDVFFGCRTGRFVGLGTGLGVGFGSGFGVGLTLASGGDRGGGGGGGEGDAGGGLGPTPSSGTSCSCAAGVLDGDRKVAHAHCIRTTCPGVRPW